jgi:hypothetical protein
MKSIRKKIRNHAEWTLANLAQIDATSEQDIVRQMKLDDVEYQHLLECELMIAVAESHADLQAGRFVKETATSHIKKLEHLNP